MTRVIFDQGPLHGGTLFEAPLRIIEANTADQVPAAIAALEQARAEGHWLAGYASYELGYVYSSKLRALMPSEREMPLLQFGVFEAPQPYKFAKEPRHPAGLREIAPVWDQARYARAFAPLKDYIAAGDIYQANLTFPITAQRYGSLEDLYCLLRQKQAAHYGALVDLGGAALLCRSPELFFEIDANGALTARPMKGTAARGATRAEDEASKHWLRTSEKNRAENLMIVDLLRNDISRIAEIGSVRVPDLFTVETYATLHQMTSRVTAQIRADVGIGALFEALFPCGSITGAPKIRAMQILRELEGDARDAYCGAVGWVAPDGAMSFGVAIRTLMCRGDRDVRLNVGGGVVHDSTLAEEYGEALLKARFAQVAR